MRTFHPGHAGTEQQARQLSTALWKIIPEYAQNVCYPSTELRMNRDLFTNPYGWKY